MATKLPIDKQDAYRLVLECAEELGEEITDRGEFLRRIRKVIRAGVDAVQRSEQTVCLEQAAWESVDARKHRRPATRRDLRHFVRRILRVEGAGKMMLRAMRPEDCRRILAQAFGESAHSYAKGRAILHSIFNYGIRREWCQTNPVQFVEVPHPEEKRMVPLNLQEVRRLRETVDKPEHRAMRFSVELMLYNGVRPAEVARIRKEDICGDKILIRPTNSKTGGGRVLPLRNVSGIKPDEYVVPPNWQKRWCNLRRAAGFSQWSPDVCRHTFASYHAAYYGDMNRLQIEMGHRDLNLLHTRYVSPIWTNDAAEYWNASPGKTAHGRRKLRRA